MRVCPHPLLLGEVIAGETLRYVRVATPKGQVRATYDLLRQRPFVALHVADLNGQIVYGITSQRVANELAEHADPGRLSRRPEFSR
jgi:bacterial leucyl aminopeptidase